ncbi:AbrB/MazE/SpoVT family DNA-binding domain-containing protein [Massilia sp. MB5]|uniref:antitoxin n=1 Tax=unclassified Massilia TaxID=2609279 RepID=UPI001CBDC955|nr:MULTISPECIES: AbrB/MazE/SpoVT family DNA-binding domain-containing protein [unclassified Massilia]UMR32868.1 AbrB/MazE/SpoVT family DNA-binding domain-containing protein [Massilia sp. MB5]
MTNIAKIFMTGRSQAVRLPAEYRFEGSEVYMRRDPKSGDVILSSEPNTWDGLFSLYQSNEVPVDFLSEEKRHQGRDERDPFAEK